MQFGGDDVEGVHRQGFFGGVAEEGGEGGVDLADRPGFADHDRLEDASASARKRASLTRRWASVWRRLANSRWAMSSRLAISSAIRGLVAEEFEQAGVGLTEADRLVVGAHDHHAQDRARADQRDGERGAHPAARPIGMAWAQVG